MTVKSQDRSILIRIAVIFLSLILLTTAAIDIYNILSGTGNWLGELSFKRGIAFLGFAAISGLILLIITLAAWKWNKTSSLLSKLANWRDKHRWLPRIINAALLIIPLWLIYFTIAGTFMSGFYLRLLTLIGMAVAIAFFLTSDSEKFLTSTSMALSLLLISSTFTLTQAFSNVVDYPFSLTWSEGNRIWDYSILFGADRYNYSSVEPIFAFIDLGRQSLWGLPFLIPGVSIQYLRLWNAIVITIPYALLGWIAFKRIHGNWKLWFLCGLWTLVFLYQGPIYTPLVLSAILVAAAWWLPFWLAIPLIALAGYSAELTRFTWMLAPAMWAGMLYLGDKPIISKQHALKRFGTALTAVLAGFVGGFLLPRWLADTQNTASLNTSGNPIQADVASLEGLQQLISNQPLLWERLLPNSTYAPGILLGLIMVAGPLTLLLICFIRSGKWQLDWLQKLAIWTPVLAFLIVGLVISVKIGGGGDLHNLDMLLIALVFAAALAWKAGADRVFSNLDIQPIWVQALIVLMLGFFALKPLSSAKSLNLPSERATRDALVTIQDEVAIASSEGEILFMDQRQLLTFGFVDNVPLVHDYEKKYLMDQAMSSNAEYFQGFYEDISNQRFALIVTEPLKIVYQGSDHHFGLENDAWVQWVSEPVLCYYEPLETFKNVRVQLLVPRTEIGDCP